MVNQFPGKNSYLNIINQMHDGLYFVDPDRKITFWNNKAEQISGFNSDEVIGRPCSDNILNHVDQDGKKLCHEICPLAATIQDGIPRESIVFLHHKDGHRVPVNVRTSQMKNDSGQVIGGIELFSRVNDPGLEEMRIQHLEKLAMIDELTQLANRRYIEDELQKRIEEIKRYGQSFGLLFMDIDKFKTINDTYGHKIGDDFLKLVAQTLSANTRPFDLIGRWGGDEFIGIIRNIDHEGLLSLGTRYRKMIENSWLQPDDEKVHVTISVGALLVNQISEKETLINQVDELMYQCKNAGRNCLQIG